MAAAVQELPSLTDTLQEGNWITPAEAAGTLVLNARSDTCRSSFLTLAKMFAVGCGRVPSAPSQQRPSSARMSSAAPRPLSARTNLYPKTCRALQHKTENQLGPLANRGHEHVPSDGPPGSSNAGCKTTAGKRESRAGAHSPDSTDQTTMRDDWLACISSNGFLRVMRELCSLGNSSKTDAAIARTRSLVKEGLRCEGCSVFLVMRENRLHCNALSAPELPETVGVVGRVLLRTADLINVPREDTCDFFDQRVDRDPDLKTRMGTGLLANGVFSSSGELMGVILAVGKLHGQSFDRADEMILRAISVQVGMVLGLCKTVRKMENDFKENERDIRFAKALNECRASDSVLSLAQQYVTEITGAWKVPESEAVSCFCAHSRKADLGICVQVRFFDLEVFGGQGYGADDDRTEPAETAVRAYKSGNTFFIEDIEAHDQYRRMRTG
jgi:hypothetical protein